MNEDRATRYHRLKRRADLLGTFAVLAAFAALLASGAAVRLREVAANLGMSLGGGYEEAVTVMVVAIALVLLAYVIELPSAYFQGFVLEHRYGLSRETRQHWVRDQAKGLALTLIVGAAAASQVYWALRWSPEWWWALSAVIFAAVMVGLVQLAPVVLLPLFYSFKPLERPALVARLQALAARANTHIGGVYEWALGAHTRKANAALAGMGRTRRILLSDTLLADYSDDEIEVVLAHELSHHVHHDLWRGVALQTALLIVSFALTHVALLRLAAPIGLRGIDDPAGLPLLVIVASVCSMLFMPLANAMSRAHERRADRYALDATRQPAAFVSAMRRLGQQNLAEDDPSPLVQWLFYSHPPIRQRLDAARRWEQQQA